MNRKGYGTIYGIGNDILEIDRIRQAMDRHGERFFARLFTRKEQDYCLKHADPVPHFAARFSVKEAVVKALGTGFGEEVSWRDLEVLNNPQGKPELFLSKNLLLKVGDDSSFLISISHCRDYVSAVAIWVKH
jgi:holo-[acyl-carrier protein] synthase